jgi:hypothetical protein
MIRSLAPAFEPAGNAPISNDPVRLANDAKVRNFLAMRYAWHQSDLDCDLMTPAFPAIGVRAASIVRA